MDVRSSRLGRFRSRCRLDLLVICVDRCHTIVATRGETETPRLGWGKKKLNTNTNDMPSAGERPRFRGRWFCCIIIACTCWRGSKYRRQTRSGSIGRGGRGGKLIKMFSAQLKPVPLHVPLYHLPHAVPIVNKTITTQSTRNFIISR